MMYTLRTIPSKAQLDTYLSYLADIKMFLRFISKGRGPRIVKATLKM